MLMAEEVEEDVDLTLKSQMSQTDVVEQGPSDVDKLKTQLVELKTCIQLSRGNASNQIERVSQKIKDTTTMLNYLKLKTRIMEGVDLVEGDGTPLASWPKDVDLSSHDNAYVGGSSDENNGASISEASKHVPMVTDLVEVLVMRVIKAEAETALEKEKVSLGQKEIRKKALQIENMSAKVMEMENFAHSTNCLLNEMQQKVEDMVQETSRQRQRAAENEQELSRVRQDFDSLRSYVSSLISVREALLSAEKHQTSEMLLERLVALAAQMEGEKTKKEVQVKKLMEENVRLTALLDKKEAQLVAMNEQCKVMALNAYRV
ncbi:hypothetical protein GIB67_003923 [Kingdonia uniflora]|uniref:Uncharacterized protein n=1 Tax=Kingdonia uniflora TaxID=39325 RepID=A0A7J7LK08_9MAGN|nr:hypothetical protein GIB67_003923 [Kingdonia uniflora]